MNPLSKLSLFLLALGFLAAPIFANAVFPTSNFQLPTFNSQFQIPDLSGFSLKDLDTRIYASLKNKMTDQAAVVILGSPTPPQCDDKADNDGDGTMDMGVWVCSGSGDDRTCDYVPPDPDCSSLEDTSEGTTECSDGIDNDGDGAIDMGVSFCSGSGDEMTCDDYPPDPECANYADNSESPGLKLGGGGVKQCNDGIDNDGDSPDGVTSIDYAPGGLLSTGDTDCDSYYDNTEGTTGGCPHIFSCGLSPGSEGTYNLDVVLPVDSNLTGDAYNTTYPINWSVTDGCGCFSSPGSWWSGTTGAGTVSDTQSVAITTPGSVTYTLTCNKSPSCTAEAGQDSDSVTITPLWSPSVSLSGPASVAAGQTVYLNYSATDIKTCARSWTGGTLTLSGGNPQTGTISAGTISAPTRFSMSCDGFNTSDPASPPLPRGYVDYVSDTAITGWVCDSSDYSQAIDVHFYKEGSVFIGATTANIPAEQGVADACGGYANHRFSFPTPESLKDGNGHVVSAHGINIPSGPNPQLGLSPKYFVSVPVGFISGPTPYFFINSINLIIIGPGSGGRSNKATIGVTPGGGFTGTINLSAANAALTSAGAALHIEPSTITCNGTSCTTAEFWVETAGDLAEAVYTITLTADPIPSGFESKTQDIPLRVRRFIPAFEEI